MPKNIVIFSDGTGQRSGERFEENRTNIYKLYRATKCGPESSVNAREQFAFYDPGIGTIPPMLGAFGAIIAKIYNIVCQATGLGLTKNIEDCYEAIIRSYKPGDRIFLFGFSRGAYTVRCLGAVLHFCGVPLTMKNGRPLSKDDKTIKRLAAEAVEQVYQHVAWEKDSKVGGDRYVEQRKILSQRFREKYQSVNAYPHFIGVFDTVATVANTTSLLLTSAVVIASILGSSVLLHWWFGGFWVWCALLMGLVVVGGSAYYLRTHFKVARRLPGHPWWKTAHINPLHMRFYDQTLNTHVGWARHALAIDEHRKDFDRVAWGNVHDMRPVAEGEPDWLRQYWFAGNHADIGGGYPEPESRLSDAALKWMVGEATAIPGPLIVDCSVLQTYPAADGMQHDETRSWMFRWSAKAVRPIPVDAILDPLVVARFAESSVLHLDEDRPYRPVNLRAHRDVSAYYGAPA